MELYDRSAWTGNDKISGNAPHAHKEVNSHFVHPWNAARQGKDRRGQIANRRSTVGGRWNEKNRPRRLFFGLGNSRCQFAKKVVLIRFIGVFVPACASLARYSGAASASGDLRAPLGEGVNPSVG